MPHTEEAAPPRASAWSWLVTAAERLLWVAMPPRCVCCDVLLAADDGVCQRCADDWIPVEAPVCYRCGVSERRRPGGFPGGADLCAACITVAPAYEQARAVWSYEEAVMQVWPRVKYGKDLGLLRDVARLWRPAARAILLEWRHQWGPMAVVPVPMHRRAVAARGFNQASMLVDYLLAPGMEEVCAAHDWLHKQRHTARQASLSEQARRVNVAQAFVARGEPPCPTVVIVDDVMTTGATVEEAARAARAGGAARVLVLTVARAQ